MKIVLSLIFLLSNLPIFGQETYIFGEYAVYTTEKPNEYQAIWAQQKIKGKVGIFGWAQIFNKNSVQQGYGGLSYQLTKSLQIGAGAGAQNGENKRRYALFGYYEKDKYSNFFVTEKSPKESSFIFNQFNRRIGNSPFGFGSLLYSPVGVGPRFEINISDFKFYFVPMYGPKNGPNLFLGIRWIYSK